MAAVVEQNHDDEGIVWPKHLAPFQVVVIMASADDEPVRTEAERIYAELRDRGVEALLDDRDERAGVKFADADLIGYPVQVTVGKRGLGGGHGRPEAAGHGGALQRSRSRSAVQAAVDLLARRPVERRRPLRAGRARRAVPAGRGLYCGRIHELAEGCPEVGSRPPSRS